MLKLLSILVFVLVYSCVSMSSVNYKVNQRVYPYNKWGYCSEKARDKQKLLGGNLAAYYFWVTPDKMVNHMVLILGTQILDSNPPYIYPLSEFKYNFYAIQDGAVWRDRWGNLTSAPEGL